MSSLTWIFQRTSSDSGSASARTPVCSALPRKSGQSAASAVDATPARTSARSFFMSTASPGCRGETSQSGLIKAHEVRFIHRTRVEPRGPLLVGFLGEERQDGAADAASVEVGRQAGELEQAGDPQGERLRGA